MRKGNYTKLVNNYAVIRVPSVSFAFEEVYGKRLYRGVDEFIAENSEGLRRHLSAGGMECKALKRNFKLGGNGFTAATASGHYSVIVCANRDALPDAELVIIADPQRGAKKEWTSFEPLFRRAVESQFPNCDCRWMTLEEFVKNEPGE